MRNIFLLIIIATFFSSCDQREIDTFGDFHQIYFDKFYIDEYSPGTKGKDSTVISFFQYPDNAEVYVRILVKLSGKTPTRDLKYKVKVFDEGTTANSDEYTIDDYYLFRVSSLSADTTGFTDTLKVRIHNSERLKNLEDGVRLELELVATEDVELGQLERRRAIAIIKATELKPDWWTNEVRDALLGEYSEKKYKLFLNHVDTESIFNEELIENQPDLAIKMAIEFKQWLGEQDPPIYEDDGTLMTVNV